MIQSFNFARIPNIQFGPGKLGELVKMVPQFGKKILFVTGTESLKKSGKWDEIESKMDKVTLKYWQVTVANEPSPQLIDEIVSKYREKEINLVVGIGGGSVTDAGKAISAMLLKSDSIRNYLEGVGNKQHDGMKIPYIAIPTTSGTGSEATKNAVISEVGANGFKKSLRHDNLVPDYAIIDPDLMVSCPSSITAACGLDAFTQLLEAYTSSNANPMTDSLAYSGMEQIKDALIPACTTGASNIEIRASMAYGSLLSGITLANAGLGVVHGLASAIGGFFSIPHGVVCGTLLAEATKKNIQKLKDSGHYGKLSLVKFAKVGFLLSSNNCFKTEEIQTYNSNLVSTLQRWIDDLHIPRLSHFGIKKEIIDKILQSTSLKNNPITLTTDEIAEIIQNRL
jgi:alcohol dehydrogenase class IV